MNEIAKLFIVSGTILLILGFLFYFSSQISFFKFLGNLPGDIKIEKENFKFYFPITTSILISILLTLFLFLFRYFHK